MPQIPGFPQFPTGFQLPKPPTPPTQPTTTTTTSTQNLQKIKLYKRVKAGAGWELILDCSAQFNPEKLKLSKRASWQTEQSTTSNIGTTTFSGGDPASLSVELFFDVTNTTDGDVRTYTGKLMDLVKLGSESKTETAPTKKNDKKTQEAIDKLKKQWEAEGLLNIVVSGGQISASVPIPPPWAKFVWGNFSFVGVVESVDVTYTMFRPDGKPVRATASLKMKEMEDNSMYPPQNPTSRSIARRVWVVQEGQTLDWIAYKEYGNPAEWRRIALKNNLDDPLDIRPGQVLDL